MVCGARTMVTLRVVGTEGLVGYFVVAGPGVARARPVITCCDIGVVVLCCCTFSGVIIFYKAPLHLTPIKIILMRIRILMRIMLRAVSQGCCKRIENIRTVPSSDIRNILLGTVTACVLESLELGK